MNGRGQPVCWIIAGPNGAGKTTFALKYLPEVADCRNFVNADLIAAGMSPLAPERERVTASRLFLSEIERHIQARRDFGFETTLAGRGYLRLIRQLRADGWKVELIYLALPNAEMAKLRVAERVSPATAATIYRHRISKGGSSAAWRTCSRSMLHWWTARFASSTVAKRRKSCSRSRVRCARRSKWQSCECCRVGGGNDASK